MTRLGSCLTANALLVAAAAVFSQRSQLTQSEGGTDSALSAKEVEELVAYHNKARKDVGVEPVKWSKELAKYAQAWADHLAEEGLFEHRPSEGEWAQKYGENIAIDASAIKAAGAWYAEIKDYKQGTPIPEDFSGFKSGHYTQMVWKKTTSIGAGSASVKKGDYKGMLIVVCNYDPAGNVLGEKPY